VLASTPTCRSDFALDGQLAADRMPTAADGEEWEAEYRRIAPNPDGFASLIARAAAMVGRIEDWSPEKLRGIRAPTLILIGDKDFISIDQAAKTLDLIPYAQLAILPDATHVQVTRRPHQVLAMITPFLNAQQQTPSRLRERTQRLSTRSPANDYNNTSTSSETRHERARPDPADLLHRTETWIALARGRRRASRSVLLSLAVM